MKGAGDYCGDSPAVLLQRLEPEFSGKYKRQERGWRQCRGGSVVERCGV